MGGTFEQYRRDTASVNPPGRCLSAHTAFLHLPSVPLPTYIPSAVPNERVTSHEDTPNCTQPSPGLSHRGSTQEEGLQPSRGSFLGWGRNTSSRPRHLPFLGVFQSKASQVKYSTANSQQSVQKVYMRIILQATPGGGGKQVRFPVLPAEAWLPLH